MSKKSLEQKVLWKRWLKKHKNLDHNSRSYITSKASYDAWPYDPQYLFDPTDLFEYLAINNWSRYVDEDGDLGWPTNIDQEFGTAELDFETRGLFFELLRMRFTSGKNLSKNPAALFRLLPNCDVDIPRFTECLDALVCSAYLIRTEKKQ
jgi:hypothetical protein